MAEHFLKFIAKYVKQVFTTSSDIQSYAINIMGLQGTHLFILDLKNVAVPNQKYPQPELLFIDNDIKLNSEIFSDTT